MAANDPMRDHPKAFELLGADGPCGVLNAGFWSLWCRTCPWRTEPTPTGPDIASFRAERAAAWQAWRQHQAQEHGQEGAPAGRLGEVGSAPPAILPEVA